MKFQKCPKTLLSVSKQDLRWFYRNFLVSAPWRVEKSKNFKEMQKLPKIQDTQTRFQKYPNKLWTCFEVFLEKKVPSAPWRVETWKNLRKIEKLFFQNYQNLSQKCSNKFSTCSEVVFLVKKMTSLPWRVETWKKFKKLEKLPIVQNAWKNVPKSSQTCFQHASR